MILKASLTVSILVSVIELIELEWVLGVSGRILPTRLLCHPLRLRHIVLERPIHKVSLSTLWWRRKRIRSSVIRCDVYISKVDVGIRRGGRPAVVYGGTTAAQSIRERHVLAALVGL